VAASDLSLSHVLLLVGDQDEALTFYRDVVGLEVRTDVPFAGGRWIGVGPAVQPNLEIVLETPEMNPSPDAQAAARSRFASGSMSTLIFTVDDCTATFERLRDAGADVGQEPVDQPYGVRDCAFRDPWGNHLRFSQPLSG
jgi:predicted enzyme related to lactoylglutathione lyase